MPIRLADKSEGQWLSTPDLVELNPEILLILPILSSSFGQDYQDWQDSQDWCLALASNRMGMVIDYAYPVC